MPENLNMFDNKTLFESGESFNKYDFETFISVFNYFVQFSL